MKLKQVLAATVTGVGLLGMGFWFGNASASGTEPGSSADPLVSKSYVDQLIARFADKTYVDTKLTDVATKSYVDSKLATAGDAQKIAQLEQKVAGAADKAYVDTKTIFQVVTVPRGQQLVGEAGTEVVLRGGKATAIGSPLGGLFDATGGADIATGQEVKPNHLLIIPRTDGRGVYASTDLILMVKGVYIIKPAGE